MVTTVITQVFPDEYHLHTLDQFLSATARLNPHVNVKAIVIGLMDRLSAYAARESESESPDDRRKNEQEAIEKLLERLRISSESKKSTEQPDQVDGGKADGGQANGAISEDQVPKEEPTNKDESQPAESNGEKNAVNKNRGIPEDVKLYEIFYEQVVNLVNAQRLPIQDTTALLGSLANLALYVMFLRIRRVNADFDIVTFIPND